MHLASLITLAALGTGQVTADGALGIQINQRVGEIPSAQGENLPAYDTELLPIAVLQLRSRQHTLQLRYLPRLLMRLQLPEGDTKLLKTNGDTGSPLILMNTIEGNLVTLLARRWTWANTIRGQFGDQDFAAIGVSSTGGTGGGATPRPTASQVLSSQAFTYSTSLVGPLIGHNDFNTTFSIGLTLPEENLGPDAPMIERGPLAGDNLCLDSSVDREAERSRQGLGATCQIQLQTGTIHPLSQIDRLEFAFGYDGIDFDPGDFVHAVSASANWRRRLLGDLETGLRLGGVLAVSDTDGEVYGIPRIDFNTTISWIRWRNTTLATNIMVGVDGFNEAVSRRYMQRALAQVDLRYSLGQDILAGIIVNASTIDPFADQPPLQAGIVDPAMPGVPSEAELTDLSSFSTEINFSYRFNPWSMFSATGRYAQRGPHITRWGGGGGSAMAVGNRELSVTIGLRLMYETLPTIGG